MRVGIDAHAIGTNAGGNETYMRELLWGVRECGAGANLVAYVGGAASDEDVAGFPRFRLGRASSYLRVPFSLPWAALRTKADLLHVQFTAPPICPCPYVVSLHDVAWLHHPEFLKPSLRMRLSLLTGNTLRRAARVFVLTKAIRTEVAEAYGIPEDRMDIVAPGVDPRYSAAEDESKIAAARAAYGLERPYVFYAGALQPRKNLGRLARAFARLIEKGFPHDLVIAGPRIWLHREVANDLESLDLGDRLKFIGYVHRDDLSRLVRGADAFAYVSLYEGFGLPVLEALACGTPVVGSTDPAVSEVAGDAAVLCDGKDTDAIEDGLVRALSDDALRAQLREAGPLRAAAYTRQGMGEAALRGYEAALG